MSLTFGGLCRHREVDCWGAAGWLPKFQKQVVSYLSCGDSAGLYTAIEGSICLYGTLPVSFWLFCLYGAVLGRVRIHKAFLCSVEDAMSFVGTLHLQRDRLNSLLDEVRGSDQLMANQDNSGFEYPNRSRQLID